MLVDVTFRSSRGAMAACSYASDHLTDLEIASESPVSLASKRVDPCLSSMQFAYLSCFPFTVAYRMLSDGRCRSSRSSIAACSYDSDDLIDPRWATLVPCGKDRSIASVSLRLISQVWRFVFRIYVPDLTHNSRGFYSTHRSTTRDQYSAHGAVTPRPS